MKLRIRADIRKHWCDKDVFVSLNETSKKDHASKQKKEGCICSNKRYFRKEESYHYSA
ncbi:hypothetical protein [Priestia filamentosa]|uniref:hypothetical protein n=1 Tax=Priestia filamentosa TaxID=1402861 RepID=UPI001EFB1CF9|nr:hypothetical protein [Priestia filamentosa]